jgi:RHS repeat-associated protein
LASKTDANGNTESYNYDAYQRLTAIPDRQQTFTYDTCPATNATGCVSAAGQLAQATFGSAVGPEQLTFAYNYAYTPAGKVSSKTLAILTADGVHRCCLPFNGVPDSASLTASYTYDNQGAPTSLGYPVASYPNGVAVFTYTLDAMERPTGMTDNYWTPFTWVSGATYNAANQPLYDGTATRTYNSLLQVASIAGAGMSMTYNYSSTHNNGQITSSVDGVTGETITYQYDALKRLLSASGKNWGETYTYDEYGNLTQMSPTGTAGAPSLSVNVALDSNQVPTNRIAATGVSYDNNGNQTAGFGGLLLSYDAANRVIAVGGSESASYAYDPDNRRIYSLDASGNETIYFYGVDGRKLATYPIGFTKTTGELGDTDYTMQLNCQSNNVYFAGLLIYAESRIVSTDRLGSVRSSGPGLGYQAQFPYGVEYTLTANDREKYATYTRDSVTGMDYAMNRYYSSQWGRFLSPDPYGGSAAAGNPQSWNRYAYVGSDPANSSDPSGLAILAPDGPDGPDGPGSGPVWGFNGPSSSGGGWLFGGGCNDLPNPGNWYDAGLSSPWFGGTAPWCALGFLPSGGAFGGSGSSSGFAVNKTFQANDPCRKSAAQVLGDIELNFGAFANTQSAVPFAPLGVPVGTLASSATFSGGPISVGATITAQEVVTPIVGTTFGPTVTQTAVLLVTAVTANGFTLAPQPGAPLTGSITFKFAQTATGTISASITLLGNPQGGFFTQLFNSMALSSGGRQIENAIWNNALSNISTDCSTAPTLP